jgi:hypothetical protein
MERAVKEIENIQGEITSNIILISPNWKGTKESTAGKLTRAIQKRLGCYAIVNEKYKNPKKNKNGAYKDADIEKRRANLYHIKDAEAHPTFIPDIIKRITVPGNTWVFWIRDIQSDKLAEESTKWGYQDVKCLVGYGQGVGDGNSMDPDKAKHLVKLLNDNGLASVETHADSSDFRGANRETMNQYFKNNSEKFPGVQSVELNFSHEHLKFAGKTGKTAIKVFKVLAVLFGNKTVEFPEEKADENLVREATDRVMEFIATNHRNNVAVGHYLIEKFYGNDYVKAKKGQKVKGESLNAMLDKLQKTGNSPSKSWFYNAVNLAVDDKEFENDADYARLNLSQKIILTYLNKKDKWNSQKLGLIKEIARNGISIEDLREKIAGIKGIKETEWPDPEQIMGMAEKEKTKYKNKAVKRKEKIEKDMKAMQQELDKCERIIAAVDEPAQQEEETAHQEEETAQKTGTDG